MLGTSVVRASSPTAPRHPTEQIPEEPTEAHQPTTQGLQQGSPPHHRQRKGGGDLTFQCNKRKLRVLHEHSAQR